MGGHVMLRRMSILDRLGARLLVAVGLLVVPLAASADTVHMWFGQERVEVPVHQLVAFPPQNPSQAQIHLNINGLGAFQFSGYGAGDPTCRWALLFEHPDASSAPILAANEIMGEAGSPFFWSFIAFGESHGALVTDIYHLGGPGVPALPELETLLADLGIVAQVWAHPNGFTLRTSAASGKAVVEEVDRLHLALGEGVWSEHGGQPGCPSGGGGGGGPLGVLEIPSLSDLSLLLFAAVLAAIGVVRARSG